MIVTRTGMVEKSGWVLKYRGRIGGTYLMIGCKIEGAHRIWSWARDRGSKNFSANRDRLISAASCRDLCVSASRGKTESKKTPGSLNKAALGVREHQREVEASLFW